MGGGCPIYSGLRTSDSRNLGGAKQYSRCLPSTTADTAPVDSTLPCLHVEHRQLITIQGVRAPCKDVVP